MTAPFPFAPGPASEPPPEYAAIRAGRCPARGLLANGREARLLTSYDEVRQVLADPRFSRSAYTAGALYARSTESLPLATADAPEHTRRRAAVAHAFTARRVRGLGPMIEEVAKSQLAELTAGPPSADLVSAFTVPYALRVICRILGVPAEDLARFKPWVDPMMSINRFPPETVARCHRESHDYFAALVDRTRAAIDAGTRPPGVVADLVDPPNPTRRLSRPETIALVAGMLIAGYETTSNVLASVMYHLLSRPALAGEMRAEPERIGPVVEEILRYMCTNGTGGVPHVATVDVRLAGGEIVPAGTVVVPIPDAADRDPEVFESPDELRPDRDGRPHVGFGFGLHYCLGAELARVELRVGVAELLAGLPGLRVAVPDEELAWRTDMLIRGLWTLPVTWGGGRRG
ncbi:cytochrome P450 [Actinophytocola sediminis]